MKNSQLKEYLDTFSAFLFDLDGTLLRGSDNHYVECVRRVGKEKFHIPNIEVTRGMSLRKYLHQNFPEFSHEKTENFIEEYRKMIPLVDREVSFFEDAQKFLDFAQQSQKKIALVTNCSEHELRETRKYIDLEKIFPEIIFSNGIIPSKPEPDMYLTAAKNLCVHPKNCLVFEDSLSGISAGKSANMQVVALNRRRDIEKTSGADFIIESFNEIL